MNASVTRVPVVIATGMGRGDWVRDCLESIPRGDVTIHRSATGGELGAVRAMYERTNMARWLILQDSVVVKGPGLFDLVDAVNGPLLVAPIPCMYLAVFERDVLHRLEIPQCEAGLDRELAITHEREWMARYLDTARGLGYECPILFPDFTDTNASDKVERHGRTNLVLENEYLIKYKGTWR